MFQKTKRLANYYFSLIAIIYTEYFVFESLMMDNEKFGIKSFPAIVLYLLFPYGVYLFIIGLINFGNIIRYSFKKWLRKRNIHIITSSTYKKLKNEFPDLDLNNQIHYDERLSSFNSDIKEINKLLADYSSSLHVKLELFEHDAISIKRELATDSNKLLNVREELANLEKIKNISEEQIDTLLHKQNQNQITLILVGFILGIVGSLIANYIFANLNICLLYTSPSPRDS